MAAQGQKRSCTDNFSEAVSVAIQMAAFFTQIASETVQSTVDSIHSTSTAVGETVEPLAMQFVEQGTENIGKFVTPIAENQFVKYAAQVPGIKWLLAAIGQVDVEKVQQDVEKLRREYPLETPEQLAQRIIIDTSLKGGGIGLITNFVPPLALTLFAVDLAAVTTLQAEMIYRIAAVYGFPLQEPTRRGEVLGVFSLSVGGSGVLKFGLGFVELLPVIGAVIGASNNAALLYSLGSIACRFYEAKKSSIYVS
ncbi:MAG: EcsC family protein [Coleofasciculaceae cyanobacterium]